ncbi:MAG: hydrogenase maturation protease [archaeon]
MVVKVFFVGNTFGGDDGIGPKLYSELEKDERLTGFELLEAGVLGFDIISYIEDNDTVIIVDSMKEKGKIGTVKVIRAENLKSSMNIGSIHDFGVEETAQLIKAYKPNIKGVFLIGINVKDTKPFYNKLSDEILLKFENIKDNVVNNIIKLGASSGN